MVDLNETTGRVTGGSGVIRATRTVAAGETVNVGGLGLIVNADDAPGTTTVIRGHLTQAGVGDGSIGRYYDLTTSAADGLNPTLVFGYADDDVGAIAENRLWLFRSTDSGTTWESLDGSHDTAANSFTTTNVAPHIARYTLADQAVLLALTMYLQGAYTGGDPVMRTALREADYVPTAQPYSAVTYNDSALDYDGTETADVLPATTVDWVLVELRTGLDSETVAGRRAALLLANGSVVDTDGTSPVTFAGLGGNAYHVVARHRNHIPVISSSSISVDGSNTVTYNFSAGQGQAAGSAAQVGLGAGGTAPFGLWGGDANFDGQVTAPDFSIYLGATSGGFTGYRGSDFNLDGQVTAPDFSIYLQNTSAGASSNVDD